MAVFEVVDVFNRTPFKGNPLAVVDDCEGNLTTTQMQFIARQFNLSETTFVCAPSNGRDPVHLRSFLPNGREVFGSGHNILGVWLHLAFRGQLDLSNPGSASDDAKEDAHSFSQRIGDEVSQVTVIKEGPDNFVIIMRQARPRLHQQHPDLPSLARTIGLQMSDIGLANSPDLPPQVVSTSSTHHLLVPVRSTEALNRVIVDRENLADLLRQAGEGVFGLFLFTTRDDAKNAYVARFFSPGMSGEDPATASAAGPLSAYLYSHKLLFPEQGKAGIEVLQGLCVGRECRIDVRLSIGSESGAEVVDVDIVGGGAHVADGIIQVPDSSLHF